jgi:hypothetical protein
MEPLFEAGVYWSYDYELESKSGINQIAAQFSGIPPIHEHAGDLYVSNAGIRIEGDSELQIALTDIEQLYLGFDEIYSRNFIKNFGAFCQPLRISSSNGFTRSTIYLIAGYNFSTCSPTKNLFELLQSLLS